MVFDASTLFAVNVAATFANALLLLWCWWQNRDERILLWVTIGYGAVGVGSLLVVGRGTMSPLLSVDIANALIVYSVALIWVGARVFNHRPAPQWVPLVGVALWMAATQIPVIEERYGLRVIIAASLASVYCLIGAREMWAHDGLKSRFPIALVLVLHSVFVLLRIPAVLTETTSTTLEFGNRWFAPLALETLVFLQVLALLLLSLTKERAEARLRTAAMTDPLTGLANRRAFFEHGARLVAQAKRHGLPTSLVAFDLDRFKQVNDTYGHPFGDAVLEAFAAATLSGLRAGDLAGRIGGEEFAAILPGADETAARAAARRVIDIFADTVDASESDRLRFTTSAGLVVSPASAQSIEALLLAADEALYAAKHNGGDQVQIATPAFA